MVSLQVTNMQRTSTQRRPLLGAASRWNRTSGSHQLCDGCNGRVVIDQSDLKKPKENVEVGKSWKDSRDFCLGYAGIVWCFMIWGPGLREAKCQWVYGLEDCRMILPPKVGDCHADFASGIEMMFTTGMRTSCSHGFGGKNRSNMSIKWMHLEISCSAWSCIFASVIQFTLQMDVNWSPQTS